MDSLVGCGIMCIITWSKRKDEERMFRKKKKKNAWIDSLDSKSLDLNQLVNPLGKVSKEDMQKIVQKQRAEQAVFKEKYGDDWFRHWVDATSYHPPTDYDEFAKRINTMIYECRIDFCGSPEFLVMARKRYMARLNELYGGVLSNIPVHMPRDTYVTELLLNDAMKTGKWKELPDCLQDEYHRRVGDV